MIDRREFLKRLTIFTGGVVTVVMVEGCHDDLGDDHQRRTMNQLFDVLLPSEPGSPGAVDCGAYDLYRSDKMLKAAINLGIVPAVAGSFGAQASWFLSTTMVNRLNAATADHLGIWAVDPRRRDVHFVDQQRTTQIDIVKKGFEGKFSKADVLLLPIMMEVARMAAILSYTAAVQNDKGLVAMGWPPYKDFKKGRHNDGHAAGDVGFSFNKVPVVNVNGQWRMAKIQGLPDGNPA